MASEKEALAEIIGNVLTAVGLERVGVVGCDRHGLPYAQWDDVEVPWEAVLYVAAHRQEEDNG